MSQIQSRRITYRHPKGRFVLVESRGINMYGEEYCIRECVLTPELDARGLLHKDFEDRPFNCGGYMTHKSRRPLTQQEKTIIMDLHDSGWAVNKIMRALHRNRETIAEYITSQKEKAAPGTAIPKTATQN